jgi:uncharacterized protein (DUF1778 family)
MNNAKCAKQLIIRVPADVKEWLRRAAEYNASSMTSEIVRAVRQQMDAQQAKSAA